MDGRPHEIVKFILVKVMSSAVLKFGGGCFINRKAVALTVQRVSEYANTHSRVHVVASAPRGLTSALTALQYDTPSTAKLSALRDIESRLDSMGLMPHDAFRSEDLNYKMGPELVFAGEMFSTLLLQEHLDHSELVRTEKLVFAEDLEKSYSYIRAYGFSRRVALHIGYFCTAPSGGLADLGRGGSDLTATVLGRALDSERVVLYKVETTQDERGFGTDLSDADEQRRWLGLRNRQGGVVPEISHHDARQLVDGKRVLHHKALYPLEGGRTGLYIANLIIHGATHIKF
jgi:hypothetical protein